MEYFCHDTNLDQESMYDEELDFAPLQENDQMMVADGETRDGMEMDSAHDDQNNENEEEERDENNNVDYKMDSPPTKKTKYSVVDKEECEFEQENRDDENVDIFAKFVTEANHSPLVWEICSYLKHDKLNMISLVNKAAARFVQIGRETALKKPVQLIVGCASDQYHVSILSARGKKIMSEKFKIPRIFPADSEELLMRAREKTMKKAFIYVNNLFDRHCFVSIKLDFPNHSLSSVFSLTKEYIKKQKPYSLYFSLDTNGCDTKLLNEFKSWMIESRAPSITLCLDNNTEAFADLTFMKRHSDSLNSARNSQFHLGVKPGDQEWENPFFPIDNAKEDLQFISRYDSISIYTCIVSLSTAEIMSLVKERAARRRKGEWHLRLKTPLVIANILSEFPPQLKNRRILMEEDGEKISFFTSKKRRETQILSIAGYPLIEQANVLPMYSNPEGYCIVITFAR